MKYRFKNPELFQWKLNNFSNDLHTSAGKILTKSRAVKCDPSYQKLFLGLNFFPLVFLHIDPVGSGIILRLDNF